MNLSFNLQVKPVCKSINGMSGGKAAWKISGWTDDGKRILDAGCWILDVGYL
jgi:hypothetical protein